MGFPLLYKEDRRAKVRGREANEAREVTKRNDSVSHCKILTDFCFK